ncbi:MAG: group 1 truncated hemoglobin [Candidatus Tectimicrobiota bacterium]
MRCIHWLVLACASLVLLSGCTTTKSPVASGDRTLFERLGGKPYLTAMVDDFVVRLATNRRLQRFFPPQDQSAWQNRLFTQLCAGSGGPCKATGREASPATQGPGLTAADFAVLLDEFTVTLEKFKLAEPEKRELLASLGALHRELVQR